MELFVFIMAAAAIGVSSWVLWGLQELRNRSETALEVPEALKGRVAELEILLEDYKAHRDFHTQALEELAEAVDANSRELGDHTKAIAEGIEHVDRAERRVRAAVRRAEKRLDEAGYVDPALEGEVEGLRRIDAEERGGEGLHAVREDMAAPTAPDFSDIPGEW